MYSTKHKVLIALSNLDKPSSRVAISDKAGIGKYLVGPHLKTLVKKGWVEKLDYGLYIITQKGKREAERIRSKYSPEELVAEVSSDVSHETKRTSEEATDLSAQQYREVIALSSEIKERVRGKFGEDNYVGILRLLKQLL